MKPSRRYRKIYNLGKRDGYELGYAQGLHDGNPFNSMIEALSNFAKSLNEAVKRNPNLLAELNKHDEEGESE